MPIVDACTEDQLKSSLQCYFTTRFLHTNSSVNYVRELRFVDGYLQDMSEYHNNDNLHTLGYGQLFTMPPKTSHTKRAINFFVLFTMNMMSYVIYEYN